MANANLPKNPSKTLGLIAALLLVAGFGTTYYFLVPSLTTARTERSLAQATVDGLKQDISTLQKAQLDLTQATDSLTAQGVNLEAIKQHFPFTEDVPGLYIQMEQLVVQNADAKKFVYQIGTPILDTDGRSVKVPLTITAVGSYATLKTLLVNLENNIRPIAITQLGLSLYTPSEAEKDIALGSYSMSVTAYTRAQQLSGAYSTSSK